MGDSEGLFLGLGLRQYPVFVLIVGFSEHSLQRRNHRRIAHFPCFARHLAIFEPPCSFHHTEISHFQQNPPGVKMIHLTKVLKTHSHYLRHIIHSPTCLPRAIDQAPCVCRCPDPTLTTKRVAPVACPAKTQTQTQPIAFLTPHKL